MEKVIIFGGGVQGKKILNDIKDEYEVILIFDNDPKKENTYIENIPVRNLNEDLLNTLYYDAIIIGTLSGYKAITKQLMEYGVPKTKIINSYVEVPTVAREQFVRNLSTMYQEQKMEGEVAEGGVFQGEFAKVLNESFNQKKLYLFDTFEGFDKRDVDKEAGLSAAKQGDYSITSKEIVLSKMTFPEQVIVKEGYFPESAVNVDDKFCFVNLDFDLYNPTVAGLEFFGKRMVSGGCILVHDYFSTQFTGVKKAVEEYLHINEKLKAVPIGDGISILITGF